MPRPQRTPDLALYPGRVAARLRQLRAPRDWSVEQLAAALRMAGHEVPPSTLYAYERGRSGGGVDLPWGLVPAIACVYGYRTASGWLPDE